MRLLRSALVKKSMYVSLDLRIRPRGGSNSLRRDTTIAKITIFLQNSSSISGGFDGTRMARRISPSSPTFLSVFSGLGGIDLGLDSAGFQSLGCIELDPVARASLTLNRPAWALIHPCDVVQAANALTPADLGIRKRDLGILAGGPPCQSFSKAAQWSPTARQGMRDGRAKCLSGFLRLVNAFLPRVILIENVQGFVSGKTSARAKLATSLRRINREHNVNYQLQHWILNAADYGVPQRRTRAILFAERNGAHLALPRATHASAPVTTWDAIGELGGKEVEPFEGRRWLELLPSIPEGHNYLWHTRHGGGKPLFGYRTRFWSFLLKLAKDQPAWTLAAQPGPFTGPFHWENRQLTTEEMLRLQSFPTSWKVAGVRREQVRQIGNATPPLLVEVIGRCIRKEIFGWVDTGKPSLAISRSDRAPPPPNTAQPVPHRFLKQIDDWPDHPGTGKGPRPVSRPRVHNGKKLTEATKFKRRDKNAGSRRTRSGRTPT